MASTFAGRDACRKVTMRPGMQCLLDLLRGQKTDCATGEAEWDRALTLAEEEHVLPWAAARLRAKETLQAPETPLTPTLSQRLSAIERDAAITAFYWSSELKAALRALDEQEIAAIPLKGPFLAERLYGDATLRVSYDLDLLVGKADLVRAEAALTATGFAPGFPDDYHRQWYRGTTTVELHHDVENPLAFDFHVEGALRRALPAAFQGQRCRRLAPEDELLFLCLHAARHRFERLSLILDLQLAFEKLAGGADAWRPRPETAGRDVGLSSLLVLGLAMARRLQPDTNVAHDFGASRKQKQRLEEIADRLWQQLLTEPSETLDWRALHSFYLEIEPPGRARLRRRLRHLRIFLGRVIEPDYQFAAGLGFHRPWQARMLRPLRLVSELFRR